MARYKDHKLAPTLVLGFYALTLAACGPRVLISTGTTIGLKATPGDGYTRPPQATLGYKRAETALVPTSGGKATSTTDAFSTLAAIYFKTKWFGKTELRSFVGTGTAARDVQRVAEDTGKPALSGIPKAEGEGQSPFVDQLTSADRTSGR